MKIRFAAILSVSSDADGTEAGIKQTAELLGKHTGTVKQRRKTDETAFYISTLRPSAKEFCKAAGGHRGIGNRNRYVRDVSMNEDCCPPCVHIFKIDKALSLSQGEGVKSKLLGQIIT